MKSEAEVLADFAEKYSNPAAEAVRAMVAEALGTDMATGYTTLDQAKRLSGDLRLRHDDIVLDLGAGRGWPGTQLAADSGCRVVSTDITFEGAAAGRQVLAERGVEGSSVIVADGIRLPFRTASFDAVTNADVLC